MDAPVLSRLCGQRGAAATVRAGLQPGQLSSTGGAAAIGASLDIDDVAGETDQDRGEGCAPFPQDRLPDGGGGGSARVVPGYTGRDWTAEIGNRDVRMKEATQPSHENNARKRCLRIREKMGVGSQKWHRNSPVPENNRDGLEKSSCKPVEQEENHEKGPLGSWARNHMGNVSQILHYAIYESADVF